MQASLMAKNYLPGSYLPFGFHDPAGLPLSLHSGFLPIAPHLAPNLLRCWPWSNHVPEFCDVGTVATVCRLSFCGKIDSLIPDIVSTAVPHHCHIIAWGEEDVFLCCFFSFPLDSDSWSKFIRKGHILCRPLPDSTLPFIMGVQVVLDSLFKKYILLNYQYSKEIGWGGGF